MHMQAQAALVELVFQRYSRTLRNLETSNKKKVFLLFSGVPGSGKTTLARRIERRYDAVRISSDEIRSLLQAEGPGISDAEKQDCMKAILYLCLGRCAETDNGLLILDASIDRSYPDVFSWCSNRGYLPYVIALRLSKEDAMKRIRGRDSENYERFYERLDRGFADQASFLSQVAPDFCIGTAEPSPWLQLETGM